jgi:plasmid stabilization system protein ParE
MAEYRLSVRARSQLIDIYEFTNATFGPYQAEAYHAGPERTFGLLADFPRSANRQTSWRQGIAVSGSNRTTSFIQKKAHIS